MRREFFTQFEILTNPLGLLEKYKRANFCEDGDDILSMSAKPFLGSVLFPQQSIFKQILC